MQQTHGTAVSTVAHSRIAVETHLIPGLGRTKLDRLSARDVQRFLASLREGMAPASIVKLHAVLRVALSDAEGYDWGEERSEGGQATAARPPRTTGADAAGGEGTSRCDGG
ncbi:hypothetical protein GCM10010201_35770 [Pilimelia columellifera subsp. columellifera]|uniref:Core-binding (CB) domain-containing protein n=1 Tax=Pilimelia columellifera subsp. columellifera TaxID=706583 RepID=A0ABN3NRY5_9ACTN